MTKENLEYYLQRGLGRAVLKLERHYTPEYRDVILDACLHFVGWDAMFENCRSMYMMDVIHATSEPDFYEDAILRALKDPLPDYDQGQLIALCCRFAQLGNEEARSIAYQAVERRFAAGNHWDADELIKLDGIEGYAAVARLFLRYPPKEFEDDYIRITDLEEMFGEAGVESAIAQVINLYPELREYCQSRFDRWKENRKTNAERAKDRTPLPRLTYEDIRAEMAQNPKRRWFGSKGWRLTEDAALRFAEETLAATDPFEQARLLSLFRDRAFPLPIASLFPLTDASDEKVRDGAIKALANHDDPTVHALALTLAEKPGREEHVVRLLKPNCDRADVDLLLPLAQRIEDDGDLHGFGMAVRDLYKEYAHSTFVPVLLYLYENDPCSFCRYFTVKAMIEQNAMPDRFRKECQYDSYGDTRKQVSEPPEPLM